MMLGTYDSRRWVALLATLAAVALLAPVFVPVAHSETPIEPIEAGERPDAPPASDAPVVGDPPDAAKKPAPKPAKAVKPAAKPAAATMPTKRPPDREVGRTLYLQSCWQCHGETARGDGPAAVAVVGGVPSLEGKLSPSEWDRLVDIIEDGNGRMPAYKEDIDKHNARRILTYIQDALQGKTEEMKEEKEGEEEDNNKN